MDLTSKEVDEIGNRTKRVLNLYKKLNKEFTTPLMVACANGMLEETKLLLDYGLNQCELNSCNRKGYSPLMYACEGGFRYIVSLLLEHKVSLESKNDDEKTAFDIACHRFLQRERIKVMQMCWTNKEKKRNRHTIQKGIRMCEESFVIIASLIEHGCKITKSINDVIHWDKRILNVLDNNGKKNRLLILCTWKFAKDNLLTTIPLDVLKIILKLSRFELPKFD